MFSRFILLLLFFGTLSVFSSHSQYYSQPIIWEDLADLDIFRVDDTFYYSASTMAFSPGAPILQSKDLISWEFVGHSVPVLDFSPAYYLNGSGQAYVKGIWASFMNYRKSNGMFYWGGCIEFDKTYIYSSPSVQGPWERIAVLDKCYYDCGLLIDDDDSLYVAFGGGNINVSQLSHNATAEIKTAVVFNSSIYIEGSRMYKANGNYYIFNTQPAEGEYVLKSTTGPWGPYVQKALFTTAIGPNLVVGKNPHQGGIVSTPSGQWYYMAFADTYPGGRIPVMAPIIWDSDGWPVIQFVNGTWGSTYPVPNIKGAPYQTPPLTGIDLFLGKSLGPQWEWNHNPDTSKFTVNNGLILKTATVTADLYSARNTLTHRILGPTSYGTVEIDISNMADGDRAGLAMFRDVSGWIGVEKNGHQTSLVMVNNITMDANWNTLSAGQVVSSLPLKTTNIWLRAFADINPGPGWTAGAAVNRNATFSYSTDGFRFKNFGPAFVFNENWTFFIGYRYGIFNYATKALGGCIKINGFALAQ